MPVNQDKLDRIAISKVASGDEDAYRELFKRYYPRVFAFVNRRVREPETAEEVVSDVFFEVWRGASGFAGKSRVSTWILGIATFKCREAYRSKSRLKRSAVISTPDEHLASFADERDPEAQLVARDELRWAKRRIEELPEGQRKVVELTAFEGENADAIADRLKVSGGTVKSRLSRARRQLRAPARNGNEVP